MCSTKLDGIKHVRDKHLAHSLTQTRRERLAKPVSSMSFRDPKDVLDASLPIVEVFCRWVVGHDFSLEDTGRFNRLNADAVWNHCTFNIDADA
jgi:hypothetical protein